MPSDSHRAGELTFNGTNTGDVPTLGASASPGIGLATFLLGDTSSFQRYVSTSTNAMERQHRLFWYGQDEYRPTAKLTVTIGLRWEMIFPESVNAAGNGSTLNLSNGLEYVFGVGGVSNHGIQSMNWHNFAPRLGFAYQIDSKTVIRGGYGWSYDLGTFGSTFGHNVTQNPPVLSNQTLTPTNNFSPVFTLADGPPTLAPVVVGSNGTFPLPNGVNPKFRPPEVTLPTTYQYNLALQRQVTNKISVTAAYVGNSNRHNFIGTGQTTNPNEPIFNPGVSNTNLDRPYYALYGWTQDLSYYCNCSNEHYNSFQASFKINNWAGWSLQGSYTYQNQYGDGWGYDSNYYFLYGPRAMGQGNSASLPKQQWTIAQTYDIPYGHGRKYGADVNKAVDAALGGWTLSGVMTYYSGLPYEPTLENYGAQGGQPNVGPNNRPSLGAGNPYAGTTGNRICWFGCAPGSLGNTGNLSAAFLIPAANTFGNYPINSLYGPIFIQQDFSIMKTFHFTERIGFTLRTDTVNLFNHTNLNTPNSDIQSPSVGQITSTALNGLSYQRRLQFSGTLRF